MIQSAWRRYFRLWLPAAVFLVVNLGFLAGYRLVLAEEAELGRGLLDRRETELARVRDLRAELEELWQRAEATEKGLASFYAERLATEERMLTTVIAKVKELAGQAGLGQPAVISYEKDAIERHDLVQRTIVFGVEGTYKQLRKLINFLELSESFLILEEVALRSAEGAGGRLGIDLRISVLFAEEPVAGVTGEEG